MDQAVGRVGSPGVYTIYNGPFAGAYPVVIQVSCGHGMIQRQIARIEFDLLRDSDQQSIYVGALARRTLAQHYDMYKCDCIQSYITQWV